MSKIRTRSFARLAPFALVLLLAACTTPITLLNGWTTTPFGTSGPEYVVIRDIVHLKGAIQTGGANSLAFNLPVGVRPLSTVYVPIDLCNATKGRLTITTNGDAFVSAQGAFTDAQCFTSLDGASFARHAQGFTSLTLQNGWSGGAFGTGQAGAKVDPTSNIVYLRGGLTGGAAGGVFTLPVGFRPATDTYVVVDLCNATRGRLYIQPTGVTTVQAEDGTFANAQCFTSLDGASFARSATGFTGLALQNGWVNAPFATSNLAVRNDYGGLVSFKGAIGSGANGVVTTLPEGFRPAKTVYTPIDLCNAENGRAIITTDGVVQVQAQQLFADAQCFTSFDGVQFVVNPTGPVDTDADGLPDEYETNTGVYVSPTSTGSNPNVVDTDGDSIDDGDEVLGTEGGVNLPAMGTRPTKKNILLEYDWFDDNAEPATCGAHSHRPTATVASKVATAFSSSPVTNPDGTTGVTVIQDYGQGGALTGGNLIADADGVIAGGVDGADFLGYKAGNFAANRTGYFHWVLMPHRYNTSSASSGQAEIVGDDLIVSLYCFGSDQNVANTIVHELGHNLGLHHGGNVDTNFKPNYNSVMNYQYQFPGVDTNCTVPGDGVLDYSRGTRASLNEASLLETNGICSGVDIDWNGNAVIDAGAVQADINQDGINTSVHNDFNDWGNLVYSGLTDGDGAPVQPQLVTEQPVPVEAQR